MIRKVWIEVRSSLWFVPATLVLFSVFLAVGLIEIDTRFHEGLQHERWDPLLGAGAEGARGMLAAIAGSMITVVGVSFSVTIVTLSLASTQYTPRILRNFMRDRANQFVLGFFVAIYTYCLIVLRAVRGDTEGGFVPLVSVAFALFLALVSIGFLIFFIHHVATSIQASSILRSVTSETLAAIEAVFPDNIGKEEEPETARGALPSNWHAIPAHGSGYLQHVSADGLIDFAKKHKVILRLERIPGDFVTLDAPLVSADRMLDEKTHDSLRALMVTGEFRTVEQDASFGIRQIVDIAMKALSPGVNDTSTAVSCLDYLGVILAQLIRRQFVSPYRGEGTELRVVAPVRGFAEYLALSFDEIRLSSSGNVTILLQMLAIVRRIAAANVNAGRRNALLKYTHHIVDSADHRVSAPYDRERLNAALDATRDALNALESELPPLSSKRTADIWT